MSRSHPGTPEDLDASYVQSIIQDAHPEARIDAIRLIDSKAYGETMVSTAGRALIEIDYRDGTADKLPQRMIIKLPRGVDTIMKPFYANEVGFYLRIRPSLSIEAPACFGGGFDAESGNFSLLLEDLRDREARFPNVTDRTDVAQVKALLDTLASLHASFWESPRFAADLDWVETHLSGGVADLMNGLAPTYIQHEIDTENFKREMVQRLRTTGPELLAGVQAVQRHQAGLPQTLLHGDTHLGNTYLLPDGTGGFLDWQLMVRGYAMHDVNYLITTALSIADRREHERELLGYYLERLAITGITSPPEFDRAWDEYRRALVWGVYIGWLTTPVVNYGWEINVLNHLRLTTAFEDHETLQLVRKLM